VPLLVEQDTKLDLGALRAPGRKNLVRFLISTSGKYCK